MDIVFQLRSINWMNAHTYKRANKWSLHFSPCGEASKTELGQSKHTSFDLWVCIENKAGFRCIVTLLHLHAQDSRSNCNTKSTGGMKSYVDEKIEDSYLFSLIISNPSNTIYSLLNVCRPFALSVDNTELYRVIQIGEKSRRWQVSANTTVKIQLQSQLQRYRYIYHVKLWNVFILLH